MAGFMVLTDRGTDGLLVQAGLSWDCTLPISEGLQDEPTSNRDILVGLGTARPSTIKLFYLMLETTHKPYEIWS